MNEPQENEKEALIERIVRSATEHFENMQREHIIRSLQLITAAAYIACVLLAVAIYAIVKY